MNRRTLSWAAAALLAASALTGTACVRALKPVAPLPDLQTTSTGRADIEDAERLWSTREPDDVRRAAEAFEAAPGGYYDIETAHRLRDEALAVGDSIDPAEAFRNFRGRDVDTAALMRKRGFPVPDGAPAAH